MNPFLPSFLAMGISEYLCLTNLRYEMPLRGFPCGHVAQICEEFLKFWLSDEHWKVQPSKLASVRCRLKESFKEAFFAKFVIYFVYLFAFPPQKWAKPCRRCVETGLVPRYRYTTSVQANCSNLGKLYGDPCSRNVGSTYQKISERHPGDVPFNVKNI